MINKFRGLSEPKKRLVSNFFSLSLLQIANYLLPLVTLPYLVRVLGMEKFGLVAFAQAFTQYFVILTDYGFNLSATKEISIYRDDKRNVSEIFNSVMFVKTIIMVLVFILFSLIVFHFSKFRKERVLYMFTFGIVIGNVLFPVWFFQGMEKMKHITILNIFSRLVFTVCIFVFIRKTSDYIYVPLMSSLGLCVAGIWSQWVVLKYFNVHLHLPRFASIRRHVKESFQFFLSRASVSVYTSSNAFFLGLFTNNMIVGYYAAAEKLYLAFQGLYYPVSQVVYPYMAKYRDKIFFRKMFKLVVAANAFFCVFLFFMSKKIVMILYGYEYQVSADVLKIFSVVLFFVVPSIMLGYPFLAALGRARYANGSVIIGSIFHIAGLIVISQISINAYIVALLVVITEAFVLSMRIYGVNKHKLWLIE